MAFWIEFCDNYKKKNIFIIFYQVICNILERIYDHYEDLETNLFALSVLIGGLTINVTLLVWIVKFL